MFISSSLPFSESGGAGNRRPAACWGLGQVAADLPSQPHDLQAGEECYGSLVPSETLCWGGPQPPALTGKRTQCTQEVSPGEGDGEGGSTQTEDHPHCTQWPRAQGGAVSVQ